MPPHYTGTMKIPNTGRLGPHLFAGSSSAFDALAAMAAEMMLSAIKAVNILPHLPDTKGFSEAQIYDLYAKYVELHGNADAQQALKNGDQVIVALRIETNTRSNGGKGVYDDRMAIIWKDTAKNGTETKHGEEFVANTEPSAQYEDRTEYVEKTVTRKGKTRKVKVKQVAKVVGPDGKAVPFRKADGHDVSGDGRKDAGRLAEGSYKFYNDGGTFLGAAYLRPRDPKQTANRDINHDGVFDNADTWSTKDGDTMIDTGEFGMYIHRGGKDNTWSAGCQTLPPAEHTKFFKTLHKKQKDFTYVLVNVQ